MSSVSPPRHAKRPGTQRGAFPSVARSSASARARSRTESRFVRPRPPARPVASSLIPGASRSRPVALSCRLARSRSSPVKLKKGRPISGNPPSLCFLRRVSTGHPGGVSPGHQGDVSTTGGECQTGVGWGVPTTPGLGSESKPASSAMIACGVLDHREKSSRKKRQTNSRPS
jgi:hypothetical protein